jgi:hypothetical protein
VTWTLVSWQGIQAKGVAAGDLVNLASALKAPLVQTPDAPTFADLGVEFSADWLLHVHGASGYGPMMRARHWPTRSKVLSKTLKQKLVV